MHATEPCSTQFPPVPAAHDKRLSELGRLKAGVRCGPDPEATRRQRDKGKLTPP